MPPIILAFEWSPSAWPPARMVPVRLAALAYPRLAPASPPRGTCVSSPVWQPMHPSPHGAPATHAFLPARRSLQPVRSCTALLQPAHSLWDGSRSGQILDSLLKRVGAQGRRGRYDILVFAKVP